MERMQLMAADFRFLGGEMEGKGFLGKRRLCVHADTVSTQIEKGDFQELPYSTVITVSLFLFDKQWHTCS